MYTQRAPAKINLGLHVLRRREDGYHDIETVLVPIAWYDTLTVKAADGLTMTCTDSALPTDDRNLCVRAARLLAERLKVSDGAAIHLVKRIPYGAGLGGGSSDAAVTLRLLTELWDRSPAADELHAVAREIGADVPFFLDTGADYATGRGDELESLEALGPVPYTLVVVKPPFTMSTPEAYRLVEPCAEGRPDLRELVASRDLDRWRAELTNDFEAPVFARYPEVARLKEQFRQRQADYSALTGSGTAVFGIFERSAAARQAAEYFRRQTDCRVWWGTADERG